MAKNPTAFSEEFAEYWQLLDLYDDYLNGGFRRLHPDVPPFHESTSAETVSRHTRSAGHPGDTRMERPRSREETLSLIAAEIAECRKCGLCEQRWNTVPGMGVLDPLVMVIGEGPGEDEDKSGCPFVGRAGQYLDKWLDAIGLSRKKNAYIANIVKCRPPGNRDPQPDESSACLPYLEKQIDLIRPKTILSVGRISSQILTGRSDGIGRLRGAVYQYRGVPLVPTYHPSGVLRNQDLRRAVWDDLKLLKSLLESDSGYGD